MTSISELIKTFIEAEIELEDLAIVAQKVLGEISLTVFDKFLKERAESLKKLKIHCNMKDDRKWENLSTKWNATSKLEELDYDDYGSLNGNCPIAFELEMPKLTKLVLRNMNVNILEIFGTQNFPVLERLYLHKRFSNENASQETIFNIFESCPNLKSVQLKDFYFSDLQSIETWNLFLFKIPYFL